MTAMQKDLLIFVQIEVTIKYYYINKSE